jgi:guanine deaminase
LSDVEFIFGSGLFKIEWAKAVDCPIKVVLATDVGARTSFSMLQTANEAYPGLFMRTAKKEEEGA